MEKELKQVQEIFPEAEYNDYRHRIELNNSADLLIYKPDDYYGFRTKNSSFICDSKDFNKILNVLKAIKLCGEGE